MNKFILISLLSLYCSTQARDFKVKGKIFDKLTDKCVGNAIIRDINNTIVTTSNLDGYFEIRLNKEKYSLIFSSIGYISDTLSIDTSSVKNIVNIYLTPCSTTAKTFSDLSKGYSVPDLISKVIAVNEKMFSNLKNYEFIAHNRCVIRENEGVGIGGGSIRIDDFTLKESVNLVSNIWETKPMQIKEMNEFLSKGYFTSPSTFKEVIENQKSRNYIPPALNNLLGSMRIQNLCCDELRFYDRSFTGPLSRDALTYYKYTFEDSAIMDGRKIFIIYFEPIDRSDPGLVGHLYIPEDSKCILKIDAALNESANAGNQFESVSVIQQFIQYENGFNLPLDYRVFVTSNYIGIIKIQYELSSLLGNYTVNSDPYVNISRNYDLAASSNSKQINLLPENNQQTVPYTLEEEAAYSRIDSIRSLPKGVVYNTARIFSPRYQISNHISVSGPLSIYQFNHVEGHTLSLSVFGNNIFDNAADASVNFSNGFSDKRFKESFSSAYYPDENRTLILSFSAYNKLAMLFSSSDRYGSFTNTILSLLSTRDPRNYFYTSGFDLRVDNELTSFIRLNAVYSNHVDHSAQTNSTFSLFGIQRRNISINNSTLQDSVNTPIYDARLNTLSFGIDFDFRDNITDNYSRRKISNGHTFMTFGAGMLISSPKYLGSDIGFVSYNAHIFSEINTFNTSSLSFEINGIYSDGPVPFQMQYALPGNISATGRNFTFRTVGVGAMFGDQALTINLQYNFRRELYRLIPISFVQNLSLNTFFNAAWKNMSEKSAAIMPIPYTILTQPLFETGFSVGYLSLPISLEFAWRLTQIDRGSFRFGINTSIL